MARRTKGEGSVYMRKDGRAAASAIYEGKRITKYGKTKTEARQKLDAYLDDLKAGRVVVGPKQTLEQYLTHWLENVHRLRIRLTSLTGYRYTLKNHLIPAFGHLQLSSLTRQHIQAYYAQMVDKGYNSRTVRGVHHLLNAALADAVRDRVLAHNPCEYVALPREVPYEAHPLTEAECQRLIQAVRDHWVWPLILLAVVTGMRHGELSALRWSDVDLLKGEMCIHRTESIVVGYGHVENETKTISGMRKVRLPQVAIDALAEQKKRIEKRRLQARRWQDLNLVFPGQFGNYLNDSKLRKRFKVFLRQVGLPDVRLHDLRHSVATMLLAAGVNAKVVQELLGHSHISITLGMYGHVMPNMTKEVIGKMDELFGGGK